MNRRDRRRRGTQRKAQKTPAAQPFAAIYAAALNLLLAGLRNDGTVGTETDRIINAGPKVIAAVLGFMTAAASTEYEHKYGSQEAAIAEVQMQLSAVLNEVADSTETT